MTASWPHSVPYDVLDELQSAGPGADAVGSYESAKGKAIQAAAASGTLQEFALETLRAEFVEFLAPVFLGADVVAILSSGKILTVLKDTSGATGKKLEAIGCLPQRLLPQERNAIEFVASTISDLTKRRFSSFVQSHVTKRVLDGLKAGKTSEARLLCLAEACARMLRARGWLLLVKLGSEWQPLRADSQREEKDHTVRPGLNSMFQLCLYHKKMEHTSISTGPSLRTIPEKCAEVAIPFVSGDYVYPTC